MNADVARSSNVPVIPEDLQQMLDNDPRIAALDESTTGLPVEHLLTAIDPATHEDRFFRVTFVRDEPIGELQWLNRPKDSRATFRSGRGGGFGKLSDTPDVLQSRGGKRDLDVFPFENWLVVSKAFLSVLQRFDAEAIDIKDVSWKTADGRLRDYCFMDVTKLIDAYDYRRSNVVLWALHGRKTFFGLQHPRTLKPGLLAGLHLFRDGLVRDDILVSKELGNALIGSGLNGFRLADLPSGNFPDWNYSSHGS